jgi:hypothetical protein
MVAHGCNPSTWEAEEGEGHDLETLTQKNDKKSDEGDSACFLLLDIFVTHGTV